VTRAFIHVGLAVAIALAPTLCCCQARGLGAVAHAAAPEPPPVESCCAHAAKPKHSCCHGIEEPAPPVPAHSPNHKPAAPKPPAPCACCLERPTAAQTESKPQVAAAAATGELLPPAHVALSAGFPTHSGLFRGRHPFDLAGVDARYETLFLRHTLRC
jgi:hypothetical protein